MAVSVIQIVLAAIHGKNYYVYVAEQTKPVQLDLNNEYLHGLFTSYSYFILGFLTILVMIIACITGILYRMPDYDKNVISQMPMFVRALLSLFGGIMSMIYLIHADGGISIKTVFLVGACAYITPATFHLIHAAGVKAVMIITDTFIRRIVYLFTGEMVEKKPDNENDKVENMGSRQDEP